MKSTEAYPSRAIVGPSSLQEVNHRGRKTKHGIKLWLVGVDNAKDLLLAIIDGWT